MNLEPSRKQQLGALLTEKGLIGEAELETALASQKKSGLRLGKILIDKNYISEGDLLSLLSEQLQIPFIDLQQHQTQVELAHQLPETMARRLRAIVLELKESHALVAMVDPMDLAAVDEISKKIGCSVRVGVVREAQLLNAFDQIYKRNEEFSNLANELDSELSEQIFDVEIGRAHV